MKKIHISSNPDTMRLELNEQRMGVGGFLAKTVKGAQKGVLPAAKREANLEKFLEPSAVTERMYHGTTADIQQFKPTIFVTPDPKFANKFAVDNMLYGASPAESDIVNP